MDDRKTVITVRRAGARVSRARYVGPSRKRFTNTGATYEGFTATFGRAVEETRRIYDDNFRWNEIGGVGNEIAKLKGKNETISVARALRRDTVGNSRGSNPLYVTLETSS